MTTFMSRVFPTTRSPNPSHDNTTDEDPALDPVDAVPSVDEADFTGESGVPDPSESDTRQHDAGRRQRSNSLSERKYSQEPSSRMGGVAHESSHYRNFIDEASKPHTRSVRGIGFHAAIEQSDERNLNIVSDSDAKKRYRLPGRTYEACVLVGSALMFAAGGPWLAATTFFALGLAPPVISWVCNSSPVSGFVPSVVRERIAKPCVAITHRWNPNLLRFAGVLAAIAVATLIWSQWKRHVRSKRHDALRRTGGRRHRKEGNVIFSDTDSDYSEPEDKPEGLAAITVGLMAGGSPTIAKYAISTFAIVKLVEHIEKSIYKCKDTSELMETSVEFMSATAAQQSVSILDKLKKQDWSAIWDDIKHNRIQIVIVLLVLAVLTYFAYDHYRIKKQLKQLRRGRREAANYPRPKTAKSLVRVVLEKRTGNTVTYTHVATGVAVGNYILTVAHVVVDTYNSNDPNSKICFYNPELKRVGYAKLMSFSPESDEDWSVWVKPSTLNLSSCKLATKADVNKLVPGSRIVQEKWEQINAPDSPAYFLSDLEISLISGRVFRCKNTTTEGDSGSPYYSDGKLIGYHALGNTDYQSGYLITDKLRDALSAVTSGAVDPKLVLKKESAGVDDRYVLCYSGNGYFFVTPSDPLFATAVFICGALDWEGNVIEDPEKWLAAHGYPMSHWMADPEGQQLEAVSLSKILKKPIKFLAQADRLYRAELKRDWGKLVKTTTGVWEELKRPLAYSNMAPPHKKPISKALVSKPARSRPPRFKLEARGRRRYDDDDDDDISINTDIDYNAMTEEEFEQLGLRPLYAPDEDDLAPAAGMDYVPSLGMYVYGDSFYDYDDWDDDRYAFEDVDLDDSDYDYSIVDRKGRKYLVKTLKQDRKGKRKYEATGYYNPSRDMLVVFGCDLESVREEKTFKESVNVNNHIYDDTVTNTFYLGPIPIFSVVRNSVSKSRGIYTEKNRSPVTESKKFNKGKRKPKRDNKNPKPCSRCGIVGHYAGTCRASTEEMNEWHRGKDKHKELTGGYNNRPHRYNPNDWNGFEMDPSEAKHNKPPAAPNITLNPTFVMQPPPVPPAQPVAPARQAMVVEIPPGNGNGANSSQNA